MTYHEPTVIGTAWGRYIIGHIHVGAGEGGGKGALPVMEVRGGTSSCSSISKMPGGNRYALMPSRCSPLVGSSGHGVSIIGAWR